MQAEAKAKEYHLRKAIELYPPYISSYVNLGVLMSGQGRTDEALEVGASKHCVVKEVAMCDEKMRCRRGDGKGGSRAAMNQCLKGFLLLQTYNKALEMHAKHPLYSTDVGMIMRNIASVYYQLGKIREARDAYQVGRVVWPGYT